MVKMVKTIVAAVCLLMIVSTLVVLVTPGGYFYHAGSVSKQAQSAINAVSHPSSSANTAAGSVLSALKSRGIPSKYVYLPNFNAKTSVKSGTIQPLYSGSPAPMGLGDFGLRNTTHGMVGYNLSTSSFEGSLTLNSLNPFYLLDDAPYSVTVQLNTVLNNVTLFGSPNYVFWTQNVFFYSARTHSLTFLDNVWNFSSSSFTLTKNSFYSENGNIVVPYFYYDIGPTITVPYPFTVNLYLNSSVIGGRSAVYFNYSVSSPTLSHVKSGSYDLVVFNSTLPDQPAAKPPVYLVSGTTLTPTGYLLYDAELMIGGPGGGSTTSIYNISGAMTLKYLDQTSGSYANVPSAFDFGTDTGETSEGAAVYWTQNAVAHLVTGPSLLYGMWNVSGSSRAGSVSYSGTLNPSSAFLFVNSGSQFNASAAAWAPVGDGGSFSYMLPPGNYAAEGLFSDYSVTNFTLGHGTQIALAPNASMGIYTPLFALGNSGVSSLASSLSASGTGSSSDPYVISGTQNVPINSLFSEVNDYLYPVFPGVLFLNTSEHMQLVGLPSFFFNYMPDILPVLQYFGFPTSNYMQLEFYNASNISVINTPYISGWFPVFLYGLPLANLIVWNSTHDLIAGNYFSSMGSSMLIFNSTNILVWGNVFAENSIAGISLASPTRYFSFELAPIYPSSVPTGLSVFSSADTIYNNAFIVELPAISPAFNIYTFGNASYLDVWNISFTKLSGAGTVVFNGISLNPSSIIGGGYMGGNYWWNYNPRGSLMLPFNDGGWIHNGGDYVPLVLGAPNSSSYSSVIMPDMASL
ncbi:MAG: thermopsin [Thermoplasmata archaeon]|nr:thermopsin [Candidatus Sysuiplasma acidicola]MBX8645507.1 thermopsin [Candidatus Sysuiplasma acidicola]